jgi:hypothetical protein
MHPVLGCVSPHKTCFLSRHVLCFLGNIFVCRCQDMFLFDFSWYCSWKHTALERVSPHKTFPYALNFPDFRNHCINVTSSSLISLDTFQCIIEIESVHECTLICIIYGKMVMNDGVCVVKSPWKSIIFKLTFLSSHLDVGAIWGDVIKNSRFSQKPIEVFSLFYICP